MLKAFLISLAAFVSFDAVAWQGAIRMEVTRQFAIAWIEVQELDWSWG